ncbi:nucleotide-binding universal stress UspA family protein [Pseudomonas sp. SJZ079]|uniref:universal stress protein n=1 Tax=Pseudomonas sp. SJZ079 TaxID=2572887 RepID=UPI00119B317B|nr:universal stress protein [Pseudomonas sp. SJZ079]TWC33565.1 nucleotide-binding universal stress UspA family protein [Pseudomonas sp. SJZ079]
MRTIEKILVMLHVDPAEDLALARGKQLAQTLGAELQLLLCDPHEGHTQYLEGLLTTLRSEGFRVQGEQVKGQSHHACAAILAAHQRHACDLVIKQHHPDSTLTQLFTLPDDWQLSRELPTPLLLVKTPRAWAGNTVLAAMDVDHQDSEHQALQGHVIDYTAELCRLFQAELHVVSAYAAPALADPTIHIDQAIAQHCHDQCQWFQHEYELAEHHLHIGEGPAKTLIPRIASDQGAVLTVLGTIGRSGLSGILVGNTAETVLERLNCDVLILKPHEMPAKRVEPRGHRAA